MSLRNISDDFRITVALVGWWILAVFITSFVARCGWETYPAADALFRYLLLEQIP